MPVALKDRKLAEADSPEILNLIGPSMSFNPHTSDKICYYGAIRICWRGKANSNWSIGSLLDIDWRSGDVWPDQFSTK